MDRHILPPAEGVREAPFTVRDTSDDGDGLTLDGWGAVFNRETVIDSWEGRFREKIAPGAMKRSFRETPPKIQFDHGRHPTIGSIPIAELRSISEDSDPEFAPEGGAHIVARLFDNWLVAPVRDAIAAGAINGMSFRFSVLQESWATAGGAPIRDQRTLLDELARSADLADEELPVRTLRQVKVPEMGPVVWPAYADTSVGVRSEVIDLSRLHDPEQRKLLARAVFMVDSAPVETSAHEEGVPQRDTVTVVERDQTPEPGEQHSTPVAGVHSPSPALLRDIDLVLRNQRDSLITIHHRKERSR